jgi:hypothetical protein
MLSVWESIACHQNQSIKITAGLLQILNCMSFRGQKKKKTHILISLGINREKTSPSLTKALEYNNQ